MHAQVKNLRITGITTLWDKVIQITEQLQIGGKNWKPRSVAWKYVANKLNDSLCLKIIELNITQDTVITRISHSIRIRMSLKTPQNLPQMLETKTIAEKGCLQPNWIEVSSLEYFSSIYKAEQDMKNHGLRHCRTPPNHLETSHCLSNAMQSNE